MSLPLEIRDPQAAPVFGDGPVSRFCRRALFEARDEVFIRLTLRMIAVMTALMAGLLLVLRAPQVPDLGKLGAMAVYLVHRYLATI